VAANPKFFYLLQNLVDLTVKGKLDWKEGFEPQSYRIVRDYAIVEVGASDDPLTGKRSYYARLEDRAGHEVENVSSEDQPHLSVIVPALYRAVEKNAARGDELIDKLMSDLSQIS
jgi:hypothetical protein